MKSSSFSWTRSAAAHAGATLRGCVPSDERRTNRFAVILAMAFCAPAGFAQGAASAEKVERPAPAASGAGSSSVRQPVHGFSEAATPRMPRFVGPFQYREAMAWNERRFFQSRTEFDPSQPVKMLYGGADQQRAFAAKVEERDPATKLIRSWEWMNTGRLTYAMQKLRVLVPGLRQAGAAEKKHLALALQLLGEGHLMLGALPEARNFFADGVATLKDSTPPDPGDQPQLADLLTRLGQVDVDLGQTQRGAASLTEAGALDRAPSMICLADRLDASYELSLVLETQGRWGEAEKLWDTEVAARAGAACQADLLARLERASFLARKGDVDAAAEEARALLKLPVRPPFPFPRYWLVTTEVGQDVSLAPKVFPLLRQAMWTTLLQRIVIAQEWKYRAPSGHYFAGICGIYEESPQFDPDSLALNVWRRSCVDLQLSMLLEGSPDPASVAHAYRELQSVRARYVMGRAKLANDAFSSGAQPSPAERLPQLAGIAEARSTLFTSAVLNGEPIDNSARALLQEYDDLESTILKLLQKEVKFELGRNDPELTAPLISQELAGDTALVEIFAWHRYDRRNLRSPVTRYGAFILRRDVDVRFVDLGPTEAIDGQARELGLRIGEVANDPAAAANLPAVREVLAALSRSIYEPLVPHLAGAKRLLVIPDGPLAMLPFSALPNGRGGELIDDYTIDYLSTARELTLQRSAWKRSPPLVIGVPDFDADLPGSRADASGKRKRYAPLVGARAESGFVAFALHLPADRVLLGGAATKRALQAAQGPRILHLATHGDFLPPPRSTYQADSRYATFWELEDQFLRSVLVFAGANRIPNQSANGVMTALEISNLSLFGTRLAVVSACSRDRAKVELDGQSTSAMRLAMTMAGAEAVISTSWPIPDAEAAELMANFYLGVARKEHFSDALRSSQLRMRAKRPHPFYWAAFTFAGRNGMLD